MGKQEKKTQNMENHTKVIGKARKTLMNDNKVHQMLSSYAIVMLAILCLCRSRRDYDDGARLNRV